MFNIEVTKSKKTVARQIYSWCTAILLNVALTWQILHWETLSALGQLSTFPLAFFSINAWLHVFANEYLNNFPHESNQ